MTEDELDERADVMLEQYGGLVDVDCHEHALLFTVGTYDEVLDCSCATVLLWRCDQ